MPKDWKGKAGFPNLYDYGFGIDQDENLRVEAWPDWLINRTQIIIQIERFTNLIAQDGVMSSLNLLNQNIC